MKERFLKDLKAYLAPLPEQEKQEIIGFYEERFQTGILYEGKSEQDIIDELESPREIAANVLKEYGYQPVRKTTNQTQTPHDNYPETGFSVMKAILILVFDLLFVTWFVPVLFAIMVSLGATWISFLVSVDYPTVAGAQTVFFYMLVVGVLYLGILLVLWVYDLLVGFLVWLVRVHMEIFQIPNKRFVRFLNRFKVSRQLRAKPVLERSKNRLKGLSALSVIIGAFGLLFTGGQLIDISPHELTAYETSSAVTETEGWKIDVSMDVGNIQILRLEDDDDIRVTGEISDHVETDIDIDTEQKIIRIHNEMPFRIFSFNNLINFMRDQGTITIYIPEDMIIETADVYGTNSKITILGLEFNAIDVSATNGDIKLEDLILRDDNHVKTTNGRIRIYNVQADRLETKTTNGLIEVDRGNIKTLYAQTTNGEIKIERLNVDQLDGTRLEAKTTNGKVTLNDVYTERVVLSTTNGNIHFYNGNREFDVDVTASTVNGSKSINVPTN